MKEYSWSVGGFFKEDANVVGKELEKLGDNITIDGVLEIARDSNNVIHNMFEWDDKVAGEMYRRTQANIIICSLRGKVVMEDEEEKVVRAFVTTKRSSAYLPIEKIVKDTDRYALLLDKAYRELSILKKKYSTLTEIQDLLKDIPE